MFVTELDVYINYKTNVRGITTWKIINGDPIHSMHTAGWKTVKKF